MKNIPSRYRTLIFAFIMSLNTSLIVSGIIIAIHAENIRQFLSMWPSSFMIGWPIVFFSILLIAPQVNRLLDYLIDKNKL